MATYTMTCPVEGCGHVVSVQALTDEEAMPMMMDAVKAHWTEVHADMPAPSDDELMNTIKGGWSRSEDMPMPEMPAAPVMPEAPVAPAMPAPAPEAPVAPVADEAPMA